MKISKNKVLAALLALIMVFGFASSFAADGVYSPVTDTTKENWVNDAESNDHITLLTKNVTKRSEAGAWDIELQVKTKTEITSKPIQVAIVLDRTGSTAWCGLGLADHADAGGGSLCKHGGTTRMEMLKSATASLLTQLSNYGNAQVSLTSFSNSASEMLAMSSINSGNLDTFTGKVNALTSSGSTNIAAGITAGKNSFLSDGSERFLIVISDGEANTGNTDPSQAAINAANDARADGATVFAVGLCTGEDAVKTLQACAKDDDDVVRFYGANDTAGLIEQFSRIVSLITAMIDDPIATGFWVVTGTPVVVLNSSADVGKIDISSGALRWYPDGGKLDGGVTATIAYTVKLVDPTSLGGNGGVFDEIYPNDKPELRYVAQSKSYTLAFPDPAVRYELGQAIVDYVYDNNGAWKSFKTATSNIVYTDFADPSGKQIGAANAAALPMAEKYIVDGNNIYELTGVDGSGMAGVTLPTGLAYTVASLGTSVPANFTAGLPTGETKLVYQYKLVPGGKIRLGKNFDGDVTYPKYVWFEITQYGLEDTEYKTPLTTIYHKLVINRRGKGSEAITLPAGYLYNVKELVTYADDADYNLNKSGFEMFTEQNGGQGTYDSDTRTIQGLTVAINQKADNQQAQFKNSYEPANFTIGKLVEMYAVGGSDRIDTVANTYTFRVTAIETDGSTMLQEGSSTIPFFQKTVTITVPATLSTEEAYDKISFAVPSNTLLRVEELTTGAEISGYNRTTSWASRVTSPVSKMVVDGVEWTVGMETTLTLQSTSSIGEVDFLNSYVGTRSSTTRTRIPLNPVDEEIPLGPPLTGESTAYGWSLLMLALAAILFIVAIKRRALSR